ncbi:NUDIX domain-containing protein [Foetidibacter luteolus]|uniref:NUDIX domain-containing protein n=1 Tax=Foetidibacter luteolus TaxID=2608880 RepID=UPI00129B6C7E|nr:NUDIX domain-containing protein [Foetidibacter luteolus]
MKTTAVIVARFQSPYLHAGHKYLVNEISAKHHKVIIVLGTSPVKGSTRNPFDFYTRERMLKQFQPSLIILPLKDERSDELWSRNLDGLLRTTFPMESFTLYGSRDCFKPYYSGAFEVKELPDAGNYSATAIREDNADKVMDSEDFRMGINYAYHNTYAKVYPTVDIALLNSSGTQVLLGRKHGAAEWRFPGGFADVTDDSYEMAAARELREECGNVEVTNLTYIGSAKIDDWRYRKEKDKIVTMLFKTTLVFGQPKAADDLAEVKWFAINNLQQMADDGMLTTEHTVLAAMLLKNLQ